MAKRTRKTSKQRRTRPKRRPPCTRAERDRRIARTVDVITEMAGQPGYRIVSRLMQEFGVQRRQAQTYYRSACDRLSEEHGQKFKTVSDALLGMYANLLQRARAQGDLRAEQRAIRGLQDLVGKVTIVHMVSDEEDPCDRFTFEVVDEVPEEDRVDADGKRGTGGRGQQDT